MTDDPKAPTKGWGNLDPKLYTGIVLGVITTTLVRKGILSVQEASELAKEVADAADKLLAMTPPVPAPGSVTD